MKFSWRIVMIVEILIVGFISYWISRDPRALREYEEAFLRKYVHPYEYSALPIPSVFRDQPELTLKLCQKFVKRHKPPRIEARYLAFKKAIHEPVLIEMVKCSKRIGLIQAPGHNSFYILRMWKHSKFHGAKLYNIFRKAYYIKHDVDEEDDYDAIVLPRSPSFDDISEAYASDPNEVSRSYFAPRVYYPEHVPPTVVTSDLVHHPQFPYGPAQADQLSPRLAVRSPRQYHSLSDGERLSIHFPPRQGMNRVSKFLRCLFTKSRPKHRSDRLRTTQPMQSSNPDYRFTRARSAPTRNYGQRVQSRDEVGYAARSLPRHAMVDGVRQPLPNYDSYSSGNRPRQHYRSTADPLRQSSPPTREVGEQYNFRVRLSRSEEEPRRKYASLNDRFATRDMQNPHSGSDRDDVRRVMLAQDSKARSYENSRTQHATPRDPYAARGPTDYYSAPKDDHMQRMKQPQYVPRSYENQYGRRKFSDKYPAAGGYSHYPQYKYPYAEAGPSHAGVESPYARPYSQVYGVRSTIRSNEPTANPADKSYKRATVQSNNNPSYVPVAKPIKPHPTRVASTCQKCHSTLDKNRPRESGARPVQNRSSVNVETPTAPGKRADSHARSSSAPARENCRDASSTMAQNEGSPDRERSLNQDLRGVSATSLGFQPRSSAPTSGGRRNKPARRHLARDNSDENHPAYRDRSPPTLRENPRRSSGQASRGQPGKLARSLPAGEITSSSFDEEDRPNNRSSARARAKKESRNPASARRVHFAPSADGARSVVSNSGGITRTD